MEKFYYFYLVLAFFALIAAFLDHFGKVKEDEDKKSTTTTTHKLGR